MKWLETTLRKNTKTPKICRDMFIAYSKDVFHLCEVKNGKMTTRLNITKDRAVELVEIHGLIATESRIFKSCYTYRTSKSTILINEIY